LEEVEVTMHAQVESVTPPCWAGDAWAYQARLELRTEPGDNMVGTQLVVAVAHAEGSDIVIEQTGVFVGTIEAFGEGTIRFRATERLTPAEGGGLSAESVITLIDGSGTGGLAGVSGEINATGSGTGPDTFRGVGTGRLTKSVQA
jgi:hypothetical protein